MIKTAVVVGTGIAVAELAGDKLGSFLLDRESVKKHLEPDQIEFGKKVIGLFTGIGAGLVVSKFV